MEMRDQFAYMITAVHSHSFHIPPAEYELKPEKSGPGTVKTNNRGNWHTACYSYTERIYDMN